MEPMAPSFTFAGRAFLSTDAAELGRLIRALRNLVTPMSPFTTQLDHMDHALAEAAPGELKKEYVRLFADPRGAPCPPWQSVHAEEPQFMGPAHRSAIAWYRALGFEPKNPSEPADHVGLLLAFYATLLEAGAGADIQAAYYEEHLAWMAGYLEMVRTEAQHEFYRALAIAASDLVAQARPAKPAR